jgi:hypothetical protein
MIGKGQEKEGHATLSLVYGGKHAATIPTRTMQRLLYPVLVQKLLLQSMHFLSVEHTILGVAAFETLLLPNLLFSVKICSGNH